MKPTAIYARVSTRDQEPETQLKELRTYAQRRRFKVVAELVDKESGTKVSRPQLDKLMSLAKKREIDVVLVWKFDRFARSTKHLVDALEEFRGLGVDFISYTESIDTTTPAGKALFTMVSAFAEFERSLIGERVKAGIDRARAEGIRLGRPPLDEDRISQIIEMRLNGLSVREIAKKVNLSTGVISKYTTHVRRLR